MAFLSNIDNIGDMFVKNEALKKLYNYLMEANKRDSEINQRILKLNCNKDRAEAKYDLGFEMIAIEQSYKLGDEVRFESHKKYIDFQFIIHGCEYMEIGNIGDFNAISQYDEIKDVIFYDKINETSKIFLTPKILAVLMPYDVHAGGIFVKNKDTEVIFKSVIKVPNTLLKFRF